MFFNEAYHTCGRVFSVYAASVRKVSFLMVPAFYDLVVAKLDEEFYTGNRDIKISLDIVKEECTGRFCIVGSDGFHFTNL